jgi:phosphoglycerate dehydrogenase-like enzyme
MASAADPMAYRVVLVYPLPHPAGASTLVERGFDVVTLPDDDETTLRDGLEAADAVILRGPAQLTETVLAAAPRLRVIGALGAGVDNIDVDAATRRGIPVLNNSGVAPRAVAEFAIGAAISAHRNMPELHAVTAAAEIDWSGRFGRLMGTELTGTTFGIVGLGNIGRQTARMARALFEAEILAFDPLVGDQPLPEGTTLTATLDELLERSLTVSVHVPLMPATRGLLGADELRRIGPDGVLIDTARGGIVEQEALIEVLTRRELKAAVLDVFDPEPPPAHLLRRLAGVPGLILSPHMAGVTGAATERLSRTVAESVAAVLMGGAATGAVNAIAIAEMSTHTPAGA